MWAGTESKNLFSFYFEELKMFSSQAVKDSRDSLYLDRKLKHYLLTPRSRVLLENLNGLQIVKKLPACYGTRRFITAFASARHLSLP